MTYPPQQPGGYGQQGGGYGQQPDPYGQPQQPGYPQSGQQQQPGYPGAAPQYGQQPGGYQGGYPEQGGGYGQQQPGYPQPGAQQPGHPGGTQQFPQPDAYQQGGFGDQYGQPGGYPQGGYGEQPPPKKKKTGLIIGLSIGAVVVIGGAVGLFIGLSGNGGSKTDTAAPPASSAPKNPAPSQPKSSSPGRPSSSGSAPTTGAAGSGPAPGGKASSQELFQAAAADFSAGDGQALSTLACRSLYSGGSVNIQTIQVQLTGAPQENGDNASVRYTATKGTQTANGTMTSKRESGVWCLVDAQADKK